MSEGKVPAIRAVALLLLTPLVLALAACGGGTAEPRPISGEMEGLLEEVAAMRQLEAPPDLRLGTVTPRDLPDVFLNDLTGPEEIGLGRQTRIYQLLGYLGEDEHLRDVWRSLTSSIAGFYSYERVLWVVTSTPSSSRAAGSRSGCLRWTSRDCGSA